MAFQRLSPSPSDGGTVCVGLAGISPPEGRTKRMAQEKKQSSVRSVPWGGEKKNQTHWKVRGKEGKNPQKVGDRLSLESRGKPKQRHRAGRPVKNQRGSSTVIDTTKEKEDADKQGGTA